MSDRGRGAMRALALVFAALALLLQVNAPIHAAMMATQMGALGDDAEVICSAHVAATSKNGRERAPPIRQETCAACAVCTLATPVLASVALVLAALSVTVLRQPLIPREVAPRGPPILVPRARGPPAYA